MAKFIVDFVANTQQFGKNISNAVEDVNRKFQQGLGSSLGRLLSVGGLAVAAKQTIDFASKFNDASKKLGVGVEFLQEVAYAAEQTGSSFESVTVALKRLQIAQAGAMNNPNGAQSEAFARLGVSAEDLRKLNVEQIFAKISTHVRTAAPSAQLMADAVALMGRSADDLLPAMREGLSEIGQELRDIGGIIDNETIKKLDDLGDKFTTLGVLVKANMAPALAFAADRFKDLMDFGQIMVGGAFAAAGAASAGANREGQIAAFNKIVDDIAARRRREKGLDGRPAPFGVSSMSDAVENREEMDKQRMENADKLASILFNQLTLEEKINARLALRAAIIDKINSTSDPLKQAQLRGLLYGVSGELQNFAMQKRATQSSFSPDNFARSGLFVTAGAAGAQVNQLNVARQQLQEQRRTNSLINIGNQILQRDL